MREVKFRAWNNKRKKYFYPGYDKDFTTIPLVDQPIGLNNCDMLCNYVLEQYTGLKDVNGKEIYENDIIKIESCIDDNVFYKQVMFEDGCFTAGESGILCHVLNPEIISNIHENPELLEKT